MKLFKMISIFILGLGTTQALGMFPSYTPQGLINLNLSNGVTEDGVTVTASYLRPLDIQKLFSSYTDEFIKKYNVIECTVRNNSPKEISVYPPKIGLVKDSEIVSALSPSTWNRLMATAGLAIVGSYLSYMAGFESLEADYFKEPSWRVRLIRPFMGPLMTGVGLANIKGVIENLKEEPVFGGIMAGSFIAAPAAIWTAAAVSLYKMRNAHRLIKEDIAKKVLSIDGVVAVAPHETKSFLLVLPKANEITQMSIAGIMVPVHKSV